MSTIYEVARLAGVFPQVRTGWEFLRGGGSAISLPMAVLVSGVCALFLLCTTPAPAQWALGEEPVWAVTPTDRDYLTTDYNERGIAYNPESGNLYVVHAPSTDEVVVAVLDGDTGAHLGELSVEGIEGGFERLRRIRVCDEGTIFAGNITTDSRAEPYRLYRWENESAAPALVWEGDPSDGLQGVITRYGDNLAVRRNDQGMLEILVAPDIFYPRALEVEPHLVMLLRSFDGGHTFFRSGILTEPTSRFGLGTDFGEGSTFWASRYERPLRHFDFEGNLVRELGDESFPAHISPMRIDHSRGLMAGIRDHRVEIFDFPLSDAEFNPPLALGAFPTSHRNNENTGDIEFGGNGMLYALDANNGIVAYQLLRDFEGWMADRGVSPEARDPWHDPSGDGVPNLVKFALNLDPLANSRSALPVPELRRMAGQDYLALTVNKNPTATGVILRVEVSEDLQEWHSGEGYTEIIEETRTSLIVRDVQPLSEQQRRFIRLRVQMKESL